MNSSSSSGAGKKPALMTNTKRVTKFKYRYKMRRRKNHSIKAKIFKQLIFIINFTNQHFHDLIWFE